MAKWSRVIWREDSKKPFIEDVVPDNWIKGDILFFPKKNVQFLLNNCKEPTENWLQFPIAKILVTTGKQPIIFS